MDNTIVNTTTTNDTSTSGINSAKTINEGRTENGTKIVESGSTDYQDLFVKLLVAQMKNQDPFNTQDPTEYATQLAQFTVAQEMMSMNSNMETMLQMGSGMMANSAMSSASGLIGKNVEAYIPTENSSDEQETITGKVECAYIKNGIVYMDVKDEETQETVSVEYAGLIKVKN